MLCFFIILIILLVKDFEHRNKKHTKLIFFVQFSEWFQNKKLIIKKRLLINLTTTKVNGVFQWMLFSYRMESRNEVFDSSFWIPSFRSIKTTYLVIYQLKIGAVRVKNEGIHFVLYMKKALKLKTRDLYAKGKPIHLFEYTR